MATCLLAACSSAPPHLNPFGQPYTDENTLKSLALKSCRPRDVDRPAQLVSGSKPLYPIDELLKGKVGEATLAFEVGADGSVLAVHRTTENPWFAAHAEIALRDWKVEPALKDGRPIAVACQMRFSYLIAD